MQQIYGSDSVWHCWSKNTEKKTKNPVKHKKCNNSPKNPTGWGFSKIKTGFFLTPMKRLVREF